MAGRIFKSVVTLTGAAASLLFALGTATAAPFACVVKWGNQGEVRYPRLEATDAGDAYCRAEDLAQNPGYQTCVPQQHANAKTCAQMEPDPVLDRRSAKAPGGMRKTYQCPVPGTRFQEWASVEAASAEEIVAEMNKQFRNFGKADTCLPAATYLALTGGGNADTGTAAQPQAAGTMSRADILATVQALDELRVARARNAMQRRDTNDAAAVMSRLRPVELSLAAEWSALPAEPIARVRQTLAVRSRYQPVLAYLRQQLVERGPQNAGSPVIAIARTIEPSVLAQIRSAMSNAEVKDAWLAGKLELPTDVLGVAQEREWLTDRLTWKLAQDAAAQTGASTLFSTRTEDQVQSRREREEAASWGKWTEPSANEMGLALLRAVSRDGGRSVTPSEAERVGPTHPLLAASGTAVSFATRLVHVQKTDCVRVAGAWSCGVRLWALNFMRGASQDVLKSLGVAFVHRADAAFGSIGVAPDQLRGRAATLKFAATQEGWIAPDFVAAIRKDEQTVADGMQRIADKASEEQACRSKKIELYGWDYQGLPCN